jgi:hypothetical protein
MQIFRVWDIAKNEMIPQDLLLMTDSGTLCIMERVHRRRNIKGAPAAVYVYEIIADNSIALDWNTGFSDSKGNPIFTHDVLHVPSKEVPPMDAINPPNGYDFVVDYDKGTGQWLLYFELNGLQCKFGALCNYNERGTVVGR